MPTRKRRRRRAKLQRHEYEYVVETDEGEEVVESLRELEPEERDDGKNGRGSSGKSRGREPAHKGPVDRRGRPIPKPTLARAAKRGLIFMPFFVLFFFIAAPSLTTNQKIFQAIFLAALFIPASYLADRLVYRMAERRSSGGSKR